MQVAHDAFPAVAADPPPGESTVAVDIGGGTYAAVIRVFVELTAPTDDGSSTCRTVRPRRRLTLRSSSKAVNESTKPNSAACKASGAASG